MERGLTGHFVPISTGGDSTRAFVPAPLPPAPALTIDDELGTLIDEANVALGRLDGMSTLLPNPQLLLHTYVRKEAVLSSQIAGTQSSLSDLLSYEVDGAAATLRDDVTEVSHYVAAMRLGLRRLSRGKPLSLRLIRGIHNKLLPQGRGSSKRPGEFRRSQNWIGGTRPDDARYVPVPPELVLEHMGALEKFIHNDPVKTRTLIKAALVHVQFETIYPFLEGNGRMGRLLITFLLCEENVLRHPMLYLSLYFKRHRKEYYRLLQDVRLNGNWEEWLRFFLTGVAETARQATAMTKRILKLFARHRDLVHGEAASVRRLHAELQGNPITSASNAAERIGASIPTASTALQTLIRHGLVHEITGQKYGRLYAYRKFLDILNEE